MKEKRGNIQINISFPLSILLFPGVVMFVHRHSAPIQRNLFSRKTFSFLEGREKFGILWGGGQEKQIYAEIRNKTNIRFVRVFASRSRKASEKKSLRLWTFVSSVNRIFFSLFCLWKSLQSLKVAQLLRTHTKDKEWFIWFYPPALYLASSSCVFHPLLLDSNFILEGKFCGM